MKIGVTQLCFGKKTRFVLECDGSKYASFIEYVCNISCQKCSAIVRKHKGSYQKRFNGGPSYITLLNEANAKACAEEFEAIIMMNKLIT